MDPAATQATPAPAPTPVPPTLPPAPTATTALAFPTGIFTKASWTWEFRADGTYDAKDTVHEASASEVYTVTGNERVIKDDLVGCSDVVATYVWANDGQKLSLTKVDDQCRDRGIMFDRTKWTKKPCN